MARHQRVLSPTQIYHVMIRGNEKKNIFLDDEDRYRFIATLKAKKEENDFEILAYCLMDNHVHLLIKEREQTIARIMKCINVSYAIYFNRKYRRVGHLFQDRFKSEVVDSDNYLISVVHYIHSNPVRAGMVKEAVDYRWSSYTEYVSSKNCLVETPFVLQILSKDKIKAIESFIGSSDHYNNDLILDVESEAEINTKEEALVFIKQYLALKGLIYEEMISQKGRIKGTPRHELVKALKSRCSLGSRELGSLLGISKSTVNQLLDD